MSEDRQLAPVTVKYKAGTRSFSLDDAEARASLASGCDNLVPLRVNDEQVRVIDDIKRNRGEKGYKGDWDVPTVNRPVPDVALNGQQVLLCSIS